MLYTSSMPWISFDCGKYVQRYYSRGGSMTSFMGPDGSSLSGGLNPSGIINGMNLDAAGNLKVSPGGNPVTNPAITEDQIRAWIANGQGFSASTGILNSAAGTNNYPLSIFNLSTSGKSILIYSIQVANGSGGATALLQLVTSNPVFTSQIQIAPINMKAGGPNSALLAADVTGATASQTIATPYEQVVTLASTTLELLTNGAAILLPNGSGNGLVAYVQTYAAGINSILVRWIEF